MGLDYYLVDVMRGRFESPDLWQEILALSAKYEADATLIEDTELGRAMEQDLLRTKTMRAIMMRPRFDKQARLLAQSVRFEAGQVFVPQDAPWLADYINELMAFPNGRHDDQVDSTSPALQYLTSRGGKGSDLVRRDIPRRDIKRRD
ncbi:MAG TPA: phage terminase large subunit [Ancylobacter sp.]